MKKPLLTFIILLLSYNSLLSFINLNNKKIISNYKNQELSTPILSNTLLIRFKKSYFEKKNKAFSTRNDEFKIITQLLPNYSKISYRKHNFSDEKVKEIERCEEPLLRTFIVEYTAKEHPFDYVRKLLNNNSNIEIAEPYYVYKTQSQPNDPRLAEQQLFWTIKALDAYNINIGSNEVIIAISDNGINQNHPDLMENIAINEAEIPNDGIDNDNNGYIDDYNGYNFAYLDDGTQPGNTYHVDNHGTEVAGIASATTNNGIGIAGVGYKCKFFPIKCAPNNSFDGILYGYQSIIYAAIRGFKVINCSWGGVKPFSKIEQSVIDYAIANDLAVVAAAGNIRSGITQYEDFYPGAYRGVLSVGEVDQNDNVTYFNTSLSPGVRIMAPGKGNLTTSGNNYVFVTNGTSYSSPVVAGALGILRSHFPELSARQAIEWLRINGDDISYKNFSDKQLIPPRVNLLKALSRNPFSTCALTVESYFFKNVRNEIVDRFAAKDTINLILKLKNHLGAADSVNLKLSVAYALQNDIQLLNSELIIIKVNENDEFVIDNFKFVVNSNFKQLYVLRLDVFTRNNEFIDFAKIPIYFGKEVTTLSNNVLSFSVGDYGTFGYDQERKNGIGFENIKLGNHLFRGGIMATANNAYAFSSIYGYNYSGNDFSSVKPFINPSNLGIIEAKRIISSTFNDIIGFEIQSEFVFPDQNKSVVRNNLKLKNVGNISIINPAIGYIFDWDIDNIASKNYVEYFPDAIPPKFAGKKNAAAEIAYSLEHRTYIGAIAFAEGEFSKAQAAGLNMDEIYNSGGLSQQRQVELLSSGISKQIQFMTDIGFIVGINFSNSLQPSEENFCWICIAMDSTRSGLAELLKTCADSTFNSHVNEVFQDEDLIISPNPALYFIQISTKLPLVFDAKIYNCLGELLLEKQNLTSGSLINISNIPSGIFYLQISQRYNIFVKPFVKSN